MSAQFRAWEGAFELLNTHARSLTPQEIIDCQVIVMRHPDHAPLTILGLVCEVMMGIRANRARSEAGLGDVCRVAQPLTKDAYGSDRMGEAVKAYSGAVVTPGARL